MCKKITVIFFATEQTKNYGINGLRKIFGAGTKNYRCCKHKHRFNVFLYL